MTGHFKYMQFAELLPLSSSAASSNILSDSLSRLSYYDLYEATKPERKGFEFNKPIVDVDPSLYKPVKMAYHDELSIFILSQDPNGDTDSEVLRGAHQTAKENTK